MRLRSVLISSAAVLGAFALPATRDKTAHESISELPDGWTSVGEADAFMSLSLSVALKQPRLSELEARLQSQSDPSHSQYGAHMSRDSISEFQQPHQKAVAAVGSWLNENGVDFSVDDSWLRLNTTVRTASLLLDADFGRYQYKGDSPVVRATQYSLPSSISEYVDFVYPVTQFMRKPSKREISFPEPEAVKRRDQC
jgi:tripeptidyl-peptidase-1